MHKLSVHGASRRALRAVSVPSRRLSSRPQPHAPPLAFANSPYFADMNATLAKRKFDPNKILPSGPGEVRVLNNTTRDAQQSNLSAEMADEHRQIIGGMINDCYKGIQGAPGYEQTWGGTIMMFDLWKRGVQPFEECRVMCSKMPDTPASALIRSNALNAMAQQPKDVVDSFIKCAVGAGVNVFTNFDAHNDWRNHVNVAEAVHKYGGHYQAALSYAVWREDPTIYNVQWAVDFFRELMPLNPHSLYVKDPSGVLTPEMAGALAAELKAAFPDKPLVFHTHYQTGFGYMSYWEAVRNGANGVECSLGFADGAGQPYGLTLLRAFEEMGYKTGNPNKDAWQKIYDYCQTIKPLYAQTKSWRVPDVMVELNGIAGGQRTILDAELRNIGMGNRIKDIDTEVQKTRAQGGKVCQVTPAADNYAREAMRRLKGGDPAKGFVPGYASMLTGDAGKVPEPVDPAQQKQALVEKATAVVNNLVKSGGVQANAFDMLIKQQGVVALVEQLQAFSAASTIRGRLAEVNARIGQLGRIKQNPVSLERLNLKIQVANYTTPSGVAIRTVDDRIKVLKEEVAALEKALKAALPISDEEYLSILKRAPSAKLYHQLLESSPAPIKAALQAKEITKEAHLELMASAGFVTCAPIELLPLAMDSARKELKKIDEEHVLGLCEDPVHAEENAVIHAMYKAAPMFSLLQFFKNYRENPANWPALFEGHARRSGAAPPAPKSGAVLRGVHQIVSKVAGAALGQLHDLQKSILAVNNRIRLQDASPQGTAIKAKLEKQLAELTAQYKSLDKATLAKIESHVAAHPGLIGGTVPAYSAAGHDSLTVQSAKEEAELARKLWADLLNRFVLP